MITHAQHKAIKINNFKKGMDFVEEPNDMPAELMDLQSVLFNPSLLLGHFNLLNYFTAPLYF